MLAQKTQDLAWDTLQVSLEPVLKRAQAQHAGSTSAMPSAAPRPIHCIRRVIGNPLDAYRDPDGSQRTANANPVLGRRPPSPPMAAGSLSLVPRVRCELPNVQMSPRCGWLAPPAWPPAAARQPWRRRSRCKLGVLTAALGSPDGEEASSGSSLETSSGEASSSCEPIQLINGTVFLAAGTAANAGMALAGATLGDWQGEPWA